MRRAALVVAAVTAAAVAGACGPPRVTRVLDPAGARRFEILGVGDTTFTFLAAGAPWLRPGQVGIAVDPRRRDALVARFVVQARVADTAAALLTGQTARVTTLHVVLLDEPRPRVTRRGAFWLGAATGIIGGFVLGVTAR